MESALLLGDSRVGKTSIIKQFCTGTFNSSEQPTIGIECHKKQLGPRPMDGCSSGNGLRLALWEVSGAKRYRQMVPNRVKGCLFVAIVCAADDEQSTKGLDEWRNLILSVDANARIVVILNKMDRTKGAVEESSVEKSVAKWCGETTPLIRITAFEKFSVEDKMLEIVDYSLMLKNGKSEKEVENKFVKGSEFKRVSQSTPLLNHDGGSKGSSKCCCCTIV